MLKRTIGIVSDVIYNRNNHLIVSDVICNEDNPRTIQVIVSDVIYSEEIR